MSKKQKLIMLSIVTSVMMIIALAASLSGGGNGSSGTIPPLPASLKYADRVLDAMGVHNPNCYAGSSGQTMTADTLIALEYTYDPTFNPRYVSSSGAIGLSGDTMSVLKTYIHQSSGDSGATPYEAVPSPNNSSGMLNSFQPYNLSFQVYNAGYNLCQLIFQYRTNVVGSNTLVTPLFWYACQAWSPKCDNWTSQSQVPAKQAAVFMSLAKKVNALGEAIYKSGKNYLN